MPLCSHPVRSMYWAAACTGPVVRDAGFVCWGYVALRNPIGTSGSFGWPLFVNWEEMSVSPDSFTKLRGLQDTERLTPVNLALGG